MKRPFDKQYFFDSFGLIAIGIFSLGYILFVRPFAELNIQFPFLDFPIFVGEILLFICLFLFLAKYRDIPQQFTKWHYLIICYFVFVVIKALCGYWQWGPLAFRNAALLYYPVFAVFGHAFYRREFFNGKMGFLLFLIVSMFISGKYNGYWVLTLTSLGFIFIQSYPQRVKKIFMFLIFSSLIPYKDFFQTSRMMIAGNFVAGSYLACVLPIVLGSKRKIRIALAMFMGALVILGLLMFADHDAAKSIIDFKKMMEVLRTSNSMVEAVRGHYQMAVRNTVKLYNPEKFINSQPGGMISKEVKEDVVENRKEIDSGTILEKVKKEMDEALVMQKQEETNGASEENIKTEIRQTLVGQVKQMVKDFSVDQITEEVQSRGMDEILPAQKQEEIIQRSPEKHAEVVMRQALIEKVKREIQAVSISGIKQGLSLPLIKEVKEEVQLAFEEGMKRKEATVPDQQIRQKWVSNSNAVFRLLIWKDMLTELAREKPIWGFSFGKPLRSISLEILDWGTIEWARDGWIAPHNSYLHIIYRTGVIGVLLIFSLWILLFHMIRNFISLKSMTGILLCGIIINWFVAANFLLIFELPYTAIPIWSLFGMTLAYQHNLLNKHL